MKKSVVITICIVAAVALCVLWGVRTYNSFVQGEESVQSAWAQVENQYQRRSDLIPNLVATVKGYAKHESETLEAVIEARSKATQIHVDGDLEQDDIKKFAKAQGEVTSSLGRLLAVAEAYPDLKANQNFLELQSQLEGTENRITVARNAYNEAAKNYNVSIRKFPNSIIAGFGNFEKKGYFESEEGANVAPKVEF